jgi:tetratricopeptide (TPR) repeat protein
MFRFPGPLIAFALGTMLTAVPGVCELIPARNAAWSDQISKARALSLTGHFEEAELLYDDLLAELAKGQAKAASVAVVYDERGTIFKLTGRYQDSERDYLRAMDLLEKAGGGPGIGLAVVLSHLGAFYIEMGQFKRAESYLVRSRAVMQPSAGSNPFQYASVLQNLAVLHMGQQQYAEAESLFRDALERMRHDIDSSESQVAVVLGNLAAAIAIQGRREQALVLAEEASAIFRKEPGKFPSCFLANLTVTAQIERLTGKTEEAAQNSEEALRLGEKILGPQNPRLAPVLETYAAVLKDLHRNKESRAMEKRAIRLSMENAARTHAEEVLDISALVRSGRK